MPTMSVKLPHSLMLQIERESTRRGLTKSRLIRDALERALDQRRRMGGATVFDLTKDVSSNKKHLDGYGV